MTEYLKIIFMAVFQGIAEFLPISSSGHLELLGAVTGVAEDERFFLSVVLHAGTLISMLAFYFREIIAVFVKKEWRLIAMVIAGSIPAGIGGIGIKVSGAEDFFHNLYLVGICFFITGGLLLALRKFQNNNIEAVPLVKLPWKSVLFIGLLQMIAILPGISRSGSTIFAGAKCRLSAEDNAKFSFFLAMAAIGGATLLEFLSLLKKTDFQSQGLTSGHYAVGFICAAVSGYIALTVLLKLLKSRKLGYFGIYMFFTGTLTLIYKIWC